MKNLICTCGHVKKYHYNQYAFHTKNYCWVNIINGKYIAGAKFAPSELCKCYEFKLDNLKFLEDKYERSIKNTHSK